MNIEEFAKSLSEISPNGVERVLEKKFDTLKIIAECFPLIGSPAATGDLKNRGKIYALSMIAAGALPLLFAEVKRLREEKNALKD